MQSLASQIDGLIHSAGFAVICIAPEPSVPPSPIQSVLPKHMEVPNS
jgi:hypothetical protein